MSLIYKDNFSVQTELTKNYQFKCLFHENKYLISAKNLLLPEIKLTAGCYAHMFNGCSLLIEAPELPAIKMAEECYGNMFCMCSSLNKAPKLPATELTYGCYACMFDGCTSLNEITMLATDISKRDCLRGWVENISLSGTFIKAKGTDIKFGTNGIPEGWAVKEI